MSNEPKPWTPPQLSPDTFATDAQIEAVVKVYVDEMRERGHIVGLANVEHLERAARIQDVWRGAFALVLGSPKPAAMPDLGALFAGLAPQQPPVGTTILPPGVLQEILDAARAVVDGYEGLLDSDYSTRSPSNWQEKMPEAAAVCKRLRDLLP